MTVNEFIDAYRSDKEGVLNSFDNSYVRIYLYINNLSMEEFMQVPATIINSVRENSLREMQIQRESALLKAEMQRRKNEEIMSKRKELNL